MPSPRRAGERRPSACDTATPSGSWPRCAPPCSVMAAPPRRRWTPSSRPSSRPTTTRRACTSSPARVWRASTTSLDGVDAEPSHLSPIGAVLHSGDPGAVAAVRDGRAAVQDDGSQLVALALARAEVGAGVPARWLDLCAGPGWQGRRPRRPRRGGRCRPRRGRGEPAPGRPRALDAGRPHPARPHPRPHRRGAHRRRPRGRRRRAGGLRPGARRRPVHRARRVAQAARGPLAAPAVRPGRSSHPCSVPSSRPRWMPSRRVASSPTPPAARTSPRPGSSSPTS